jgi:hypothetical protein
MLLLLCMLLLTSLLLVVSLLLSASLLLLMYFSVADVSPVANVPAFSGDPGESVVFAFAEVLKAQTISCRNTTIGLIFFNAIGLAIIVALP